jgi:5-methylcytosine-specific restriction enzyme subunit McrC
MLNKQLICSFDEYTEDILMNRILKSIGHILCKSEEVSQANKKSLKRSLLYLDKVSFISVNCIPWNDLKYHRNNMSYRYLMNICYLVTEGLLMSKSGKLNKLRSYIDDQQMSRLYEKFLLEYFKKHYPMFAVTASYIDWQTDDGVIDFLPQMRSDVTIKYGDVTMIIDAKYYSKSMQGNQYSDQKTIHSNNLYQIFTYVKNKDFYKTGSVMGMVLYAKTDELIKPDEKYEMSGNSIYVRTLDLDCDFSRIEEQLENIAHILFRV